jgi:hypothetical protein
VKIQKNIIQIKNLLILATIIFIITFYNYNNLLIIYVY